MKKNIFIGKRGVNEVGLGIILMGILLFFGAVFMDSEVSLNTNSGKNNDDKYKDPDNENVIWMLNNTELGRQTKETESYPNIELGAKVKNDVIYIGNSFRLVANPFSQNDYEIDLSFSKPEDVTNILVYFNIERLSGEMPLIVKYNGNEVLKTLAKSSDLPLKIPVRISNPDNFTSMKLSFEIDKPKFYSLFNWNKVEFTEFRVLEVSEDKSNKIREFNFQIDNPEFLENVYMDLLVDCKTILETSPAIKAEVNGYIILNNNPDCQSSNTKLTGNIPLNILNENNNDVKFSTDGFYTLGYSINKVYFNDKTNYKFSLNSFSNLGDVTLSGDFDRSYLDLRINNHRISLKRNEFKSIIQYLRIGSNEIKILNDKVEIDELVIESEEFFY